MDQMRRKDLSRQGRKGKGATGRFADAIAQSVRHFETLEDRTLYTASPVTTQAAPLGAMQVVRAAMQQPRITLVNPQNGGTNVPVNTFVSTELFLPNGGVDASTLVDAN